MPGEQDPSKFEAFKSTVGSTLESIKGKTAIALIGAVGLTGGAIAEQASTEPARAADVPEATASDQLQDCVDDALDGLHINRKFTTMVSPGDRRKQQLNTNAILDPVSSECLPLISRETPRIFFKMQRPKNHKQWRKTKSQPMADDYDPIDGNAGGEGSAFVWSDYGSGPMRNRHFLYRCTPGKGITHVRAVYKLKVDSAVDGHTMGRKTYSAPVKIVPINPALPHPLGGGVRKAC